jgi:hypothetical protein
VGKLLQPPSRESDDEPFRRFWSRIRVSVAPAVPASAATAEHLQSIVARLLGVASPKPKE